MPDASVLNASTPGACMPGAFVPEPTEVWDAACGIADAGAAAQDGSYGAPGWTCTIPAQARKSTICKIMSNQYGGCRPTQYYLSCSEEPDLSSLGCTYGGSGTYGAGDSPPIHFYSYCCSCEGTDAATGCVNVDVSAYDHSCTRDSDCIAVQTGTWCPGDCACGGPGNAAINGRSGACYQQAMAAVRPLLTDNCNCPSFSSECAPNPWAPVCVQGVCTIGSQSLR